MSDYKGKSWFIRAAKILAIYNLPPVHILVENPPPKDKWTHTCKTAVFTHWADELTSQAALKPTLANLSMDFRVGTPHPIWTTTHSAFHDIRKSILKVKLITNVYVFQANRSRFNKYAVDPTCPLCGSEPETLQHFLVSCVALSSVRDRWMRQISEYVTEMIDNRSWILLENDDFKLVRFLLDSTNFTDDHPILKKVHVRSQLEFLTRNLCFDLHRTRIAALSST